jgi:DNA-binding response OmpR family regulator
MRAVHLLHVEDDALQQRLIRHHLKQLPECQFAITYATNEDAAVASFQGGGIELVIIDYHLMQGNGLSCLRQIRARDPVVPIIAVSGVATPEIAAELLEAGADDYFSKGSLSSDALARGIRAALARADLWRHRSAPARQQRSDALCLQACRSLLPVGATLVQHLDQLEVAARVEKLSVEQVQTMFEDVCASLVGTIPPGAPSIQRQLRPLLLETLFRLSGTPIAPPSAGPAPATRGRRADAGAG